MALEISKNTMALLEFVKAQRRALHMIPELAHNEVKTQAHLIATLKELGYKPRRMGTGVVVDIKGKESKKGAIALRADMDGLPIVEKNDVEYKSTHEGIMHACGHDGHMACLLGFAKSIAGTVPRYNLRLIFQPAEEAEGGAESMIEQGVLDNVGEIYAIHLSPDYPLGHLATDSGGILAGAVDHDITFYGKKGHCADAIKSDAILAGAEYFALIKERIKRYKNTLLHLGSTHGGTASNIVCDELVQHWTLRYFSEQDKEAITLLMAHTLNEVCDKTSTEHRFVVGSVYPPVVNSDYAFRVVTDTVDVETAMVKYTAEDFAYYCREIEGCFTWLGIDDGTRYPLHSDKFDFDEYALLYGIEFFNKLII